MTLVHHVVRKCACRVLALPYLPYCRIPLSSLPSYYLITNKSTRKTASWKLSLMYLDHCVLCQLVKSGKSDFCWWNNNANHHKLQLGNGLIDYTWLDSISLVYWAIDVAYLSSCLLCSVTNLTRVGRCWWILTAFQTYNRVELITNRLYWWSPKTPGEDQLRRSVSEITSHKRN